MGRETEGVTTAAPAAEPPGDIPAADFAAAGHELIDWIATYLDDVERYPVLSPLAPGDVSRRIGRAPPLQGNGQMRAILADFERDLLPGITHWNHPAFFAYFAISGSAPGILAELLTAALNVNAMLWKSAPAATELEQVTLSWLRQWILLPESFFGIIYDTASIGVMQAIAAARDWIAPECRVRGMQRDLVVYISEHTHSSSEKASIVLGFGQENVRKIPVDNQFRMRADLLEAAINADLAAGKRPCCIVASVGSTSTTAIDPIPAIADIAERYQIWLHVDAAYGGPAAVVPEMRHVLDSVERAHSLILNPHKWLYVSIDCSVLYTRYPEILRRSSSLTAEYLQTSEDDRVINYMDYGVQLGRRFRALKLWYVFRYYGRQGIIRMLRESLRLAKILTELINDDPEFEISAPVPFSLVCFRHRGSNDFNRHLLAAINVTGQAFLSHTVLNGTFVLRFAIGNFQTTEQDIREAWNLIRETARELSVTEPATVAGT